jgi:hypothetical protein
VIEKKDNDTVDKTKSRYRNVLRKWDKTTSAYIETDVGADASKVDEGEIAFIFKRRTLEDIHGRAYEEKSEVDIVARGLQDLLKDFIGSDYPGQNLDGKGNPVNIVGPYAPLVSDGSSNFILDPFLEFCSPQLVDSGLTWSISRFTTGTSSSTRPLRNQMRAMPTPKISRISINS